LSVEDVVRGLQMLEFFSVVAVEELVARGHEPTAAEPAAAAPSEAWFTAFMDALERMLDDCGLSDNKAFVARHIFFGWPLREPGGRGSVLDGPSAAERLGTSVDNVRQLKLRARKAIRARLQAALQAAGLEAVEPCLWGVVALLAAIEEEEDDLDGAALRDCERVLTHTHEVLLARVPGGGAPRWLCELAGLALWQLRKVAEA
jgi:hypothetical protein